MIGRRVAHAVLPALIALAPAVTPAPVSATAKPGDRIPVPEGFAVAKPRGVDQRVVYARTVGERKHGVDKALIEQTCSTFRQLDPSAARPVFEAGWDQPAKVEVQHFENSRWRVEFTTTTGYACSNAADLPRTKFAQPCGCIYRETVARHTHIRELSASRIETASIDHRARTVRRSSGPASPGAGLSPDRGAELAARLAPTVTGTETIVGLACELRRQDVPGGGWQEWCVTPNDAKAVPDERLRARSLRHAQYAVGAGGAPTPILSDRTVELVPDVLIDESFFAVPADYATTPAAPGARR